MNSSEALAQRMQQLDDALTTGDLTPEEKVRAVASFIPSEHAVDVWDFLDGYSRENGTKALFMADVAYQRLKAQQEAERRLAGENYTGTTSMTWDELAEAATEFLVDDLVPADSQVFLVARNNMGKTFAYIDMVCRMACGMEWLNKKTRQAKTLLVLGEGRNGFLKRIQAWMNAHGKTRADLEPWLAFVDGANLNNDESLERIRGYAAEHEAELIIFDTWANTSGVIKEEDNGLNNITLARAETIRPGATLFFVHHPRKAEEDTDHPVMRGAGSLQGRADVVMTLWEDREFVSASGSSQRWLALSTDPSHKGKNRNAATETLRGLYLSEDDDVPVFVQEAGEALSTTARKVRKLLAKPMGVAEYQKMAGVSEKTARRHLAAAVAENVAEIERGAGASPDRYIPTAIWAGRIAEAA